VRRWLITISRRADLAELRREIAASGGVADSAPPTPLGDDEQVLEADGPDDLPARLGEHPAVMKVSPDTPKHPYGL
jgi:hypothetical protein